jgi:phosphotransferase system enzyme I (PtsI)
MTKGRRLFGIGVSAGIAAGPAVVLRRELPDVPHRVVSPDAVEDEVRQLHDAIAAVRQSLERLRVRARERVGSEEAKIFDAQLLMLEDRDFLDGVERLIRDNQLTAERAFEFKSLEVRALWTNSDNTQLRDRIADLSWIHLRVLNHLLGREDEEQLHAHGRPAIVVTHEVTPGLTIQFERDHVVGFVSEEGTRTAHAAILARSLGIPCVMGLPHALERIPAGSDVVIDGTRGTILIAPTDEDIAEIHRFETRRQALLDDLEAVVRQPAETLDGDTVALRGNLDLPEELDLLRRHGAEGVGLLRTEFMVVGRSSLPSEDEQVDYFRRVARLFRRHPVVVRSYDVGGDKFPAAFRIVPEPNPFLGWRAVRVCLDRPEVFVTQLRALLRARLDGDVRLMLPLVIEVGEITHAKALIAQAREELERDGIAHAPDLPTGVMVETPAAVTVADQLAAHCDFLSVGTNDLTQYTLAMDRGNARLAERFSGFHPAVLRMLQALSRTAAAAGASISVCGEMASEPLGIFLLLGLGYRELSVAPTTIPLVRWLVRRLRRKPAEEAAAEALQATSAPEAIGILEERLAVHVDLELVDAGWLPMHRSAASLQRRRSDH